MISRDRRAVAKGVAAKIAVAGVLSIGAAVGSAATAAAEPPPPLPDPAVPVPPPAPEPPPTNSIGTTLAQNGQQPGPGGLPLSVFASPDTDTAPASGFDFLLSQHQVPAVPGSQPATSPAMNTLNSVAYLSPENFPLSAQGQQSMYSVAPRDPEAPPPGFIDYAKGAHGLWHMGIGQMPQDQLGQPLAGTAPPPGTNIPAGPEQFLPDPAPPPGLPPTPPPGG